MDEANRFLRQTVKYTTYITLVWAVLWAVVPGWKSVFSGLAIGSLVSVYFAVSMGRQLQAAVTIALRDEKRKPGFPLVSRIAVIALAVMVVKKLSYPNALLMIAAFFTYQLVIFAGFVLNRKKQQESKPEGVK
ncbi:ATP synthase subunit I [Effusibacillus dendaii]|uniref:ATP synthase subunit I n=1 Tax=Effusibacillus dendaii TaxID=2743772 RepID=A0A7I8DC30_9BACL|nr:ATP synthase subunit I [Effusibacillus dendaii]BCJ87718.1 hypothetical protein skT53_27030 [Effusibacillus dendaii]